MEKQDSDRIYNINIHKSVSAHIPIIPYEHVNNLPVIDINSMRNALKGLKLGGENIIFDDMGKYMDRNKKLKK